MTMRTDHRITGNRRLNDALDQAAFCALTQSPGCRSFYDQHRAKGDVHHQALRALANRLVSILHGCLEHRSLYNEATAWAHRQPAPTEQAARQHAPPGRLTRRYWG
jgi:hypothetical protein